MRGEMADGPRALHLASQATLCVSMLIFMYECFAYNVIFLRKILPAVGKADLAPVFRVLFNVVWGLGLWSYHQAHWADPGEVPQVWYDWVRRVGDALPIAPSRPEWQPGRATLCRKCPAPRPERAHHCMMSGKCVMRMDHHCPWINNCVGLYNHKFFLLLAIYAWLASLISIGTALPELARSGGIAFGFESIEDLQLEREAVTMLDVWAFLVAGIFSSLIALMLTSLLATHLPLACRNMTTIEDFYENMPNPYDQGSMIGNLAQVFGEPGIDWLLPVRPRRPTSDGIIYPTSADRKFGAAGARSVGVVGSAAALALAEGGEAGEASQRWALLHEEGVEAAEAAWRIRYGVRTPEEMERLQDPGRLTSFFACGASKPRAAQPVWS